MKSHTIHECYVGTQFPCALEYDDVSGLEEDEERQLDAWILGLVNEVEANYRLFNPVLHFEYGEQSEFETCDVTGLRGNCVAVSVIILV